MHPETLSDPRSTKGRRVAGILERDPTASLLGGLILVAILCFGLVAPARFFSSGTLRAMAFEMPELGILALAMMVALLSGGLNLAIIATSNLSGLVIAGVIVGLIRPESSVQEIAAEIALAFAAGLVTSLVVGLVTGSVVAFLGVHPILVTLSTMIALKGLAVLITGGRAIGGFPPAILFLGDGALLGIPVSLLLFAVCAILVAKILSDSPFGIAVRMIGSNEKATRFSGVATDRVLVGVYVLSSVLCWVASIVMMARFNSARSGYAESYLLITILAAVLGGVNPFGGFGRIYGLVLSLILLQVISTGFTILGFSPHLKEGIWGATMILATLLLALRGKLAQTLNRKAFLILRARRGGFFQSNPHERRTKL